MYNRGDGKPQLSAQILEYYNKFGQNRNLEKYLKLNKCYYKTSGSEGSITNLPENDSGESQGRPNLNIEKEKCHSESAKENVTVTKDYRTTRSEPDNLAKSGNEELGKIETNDANVKVKKTVKHHSKKKKSKYDFNLESSIEINIQGLPKQDDSFLSGLKDYRSSESQTKEISVDTPIKPITANINEISPSMKNDQNDIGGLTSPASSIASNKMRLEWDSMADVGYNRKTNNVDDPAISSMERKALKKFFAVRGLNFDDENIIILSQRKRAKEQDKNIDKTVENKKVVINLDKQKLSHDLENTLNMCSEKVIKLVDPNAQSTPKNLSEIERNMENENKIIYGSEKTNKKKIEEVVFIESNQENEKYIGKMTKAIQTSRIELVSCGTETDETKRSSQILSLTDLKNIIDDTQFSSKLDSEEHSISANSFEYLSNGSYLKIRNKENIPPSNKQSDKSSDVEGSVVSILKAGSNMATNSSKNSKEVKPKVEYLYKNREFETCPKIDENKIKTKRIDKEKHDEIQMSVKLLTSLIESKTINCATKRKLVKKIVEKLAASKNSTGNSTLLSNNTSSKELTTSNKSVNTVESIESSYDDPSIKKKISKLCTEISNMNKKSNNTSSDKIAGEDSSGASVNSNMDINSENVSPEKNVYKTPKLCAKSKSENLNKIRQEMTREWLKPMTFSEMDYEMHQQVKELHEQTNKKEEKRKVFDRNLIDNKEKLLSEVEKTVEKLNLSNCENIALTADKSVSVGRSLVINDEKETLRNNTKINLKEIIKKEKLEWIENEIKHLEKLKQKLMTEQQDMTSNISNAIKKSIENVEKLPLHLDLQHPNSKSSSSISTPLSSKILKETNKESRNSATSKQDSMIKSQHDIIAQVSKNNHNKDEMRLTTVPGTSGNKINSKLYENSLSTESKKMPKTIATAQDEHNNTNEILNKELSVHYLSWNSHAKIDKYMKNRSKLMTPSSSVLTSTTSTSVNSNSIIDFAKNKKDEFIRKYEESHGKLFETNPYKKPYSVDYYSEPIEGEKIKSVLLKKHHSQLQQQSEKYRPPKSSTSINTSDVFYSSQSLIINHDENSLSTNRNSYPSKKDSKNVSGIAETGVAVQTSNSIILTKPIYGAEIINCECLNSKNCKCNCKRKSTQIIDGTKMKNKQQQARPQSLAYVLMFDENSKLNKKKSTNSSEPHENNKLYKDVFNSAQETTINEVLSASEFQNNPDLSIQEYLIKKKSNFFNDAEKRRNYILSLHKQREKRNAQRQAVVAGASDTSLVRNIHNITPVPIGRNRPFSTRRIKIKTKNIYKNLPENKRIKEIDKQNKIKKSNMILMKLYNKNLQKNVLKGVTSYSNNFVIG